MMAEEQQDYQSPARDAQAAAESSGALTKGQNKLGFMMTMDSGDWRGKGTEYNLQKQQGQGAQQTSDDVPRKPMALPPSDAYQAAHDMSYAEKHEAGVPFEHAGYMWIRDLHGNIVPISESSAFIAKYNNDKNQEQMKAVKPEPPAQSGGSAVDRLREHFKMDKKSDAGGGQVMSDAVADPVGGGQKFAENTVRGAGNTTYVQKPDGRWWQHDNMGPVGPMPIGWTPPPVRAPGR